MYLKKERYISNFRYNSFFGFLIKFVPLLNFCVGIFQIEFC